VTTVRIVALGNLSAIDHFSGMGDGAQMSFSNDGLAWSPAETYDSVKAEWNLGDYGGHTSTGLKRIHVRFMDAAGNWSVAFYDEIYFAPPLAVETTGLPDGSIGIPYFTTLAASGGFPPYTWTLHSGVLPDGLDLTADGVIQGLPEGAASYLFSVAVVDSCAETVAADLSISVHEARKMDVNGDGLTNVVDVLFVVNNILGIVHFTPVQQWAADVNEDEQINVLDAVELVNSILGVSPKGRGIYMRETSIHSQGR